MKSISSISELNNKSWSFFLGASSMKQYAITRHIYQDNYHQNEKINRSNSKRSSSNEHDHSIDVFFMDGLIKNHR